MIKTLALTNFRNHKNYALNFNNITILIGPNGIGKTNIIEAIWLLASGRSWRTNHDLEAICWGEDFAKIVGKIKKEGKEKSLELILQREASGIKQNKTVKINGVKKRLIELLGETPAVLFSPEAIQMIDGPPLLRRRFLDIMLSQVDKKYALCLLDFIKILKGRNRLLFYIKIGNSKEDELEFWDEKFIALSKYLINRRKEAMDFFNQKVGETYQLISGKKEDLYLEYRSSVEPGKIKDYLIASRRREIEQAITLAGPHRDDFEIILDERDITKFGSRGEYRSTVLALKMLELEFLAGEKEERPVLLLDDIFSELDKERRMHLASIVSGQQTIITTTDLDHIEKSLIDKAKLVELGE